MKKITFHCLLMLGLLFSFSAHAGGGAIGASPATGFKVFFGGGGSSFYLPIRFEGEGHLGSEGSHGVGGEIGFDIGVGNNAFNVFSFMPQYKYYFRGAQENGIFAGAYIDLRFRSGFNLIGMGGQGGYNHFLNDQLSIYGAFNVGFSSGGFKNAFVGTTVRTTGGEFGLKAGIKYNF